MFGGGNNMDNIPTSELSVSDFIDGALSIIDLLVKAELAPSKSEARRNVQQCGVSIDGEKVIDTNAVVTLDSIKAKGEIVVKRGKKAFRKVKVAD